MTRFVFDSYSYDPKTGDAVFAYSSESPDYSYVEKIHLNPSTKYNKVVFDRALFLVFILIGTSYYKSFPTKDVFIKNNAIDAWQAGFFSKVFQEGLSQFAFENNIYRDNLAEFKYESIEKDPLLSYDGSGIMTLQSGGKDSLLTGQLLSTLGHDFSTLYVTNSTVYPKVIDELEAPTRLVKRQVDTGAIRQTLDDDGLNGHVPVTYIVLGVGLLQAILDGRNTLLAAIGHEGEEPHGWIGNLPVNHQWSKTWYAEQLFADYVKKYVSPDIRVGSALREFSELKISELFVDSCWKKFGHTFSSCNQANYRQGRDNTTLTWCGDCPKCANSFLLFAPFLPRNTLTGVFRKNLLQSITLQETFKGLLGIDGVMKPFECVGEVGELRKAYHMAIANGYEPLSFEVLNSDFDKELRYPSQPWASGMIQ